MHRRLTAIFGAVAFLIMLSSSALARHSPVDEVRLGFFQHDSAIIGTRKEKGIDFAFEILSGPLVRSRLLGLPRVVLGGALNSSYNAGTITLPTPLAPGQSVNLQFLLGVQKTGSFKFFFNVEALP